MIAKIGRTPLAFIALASLASTAMGQGNTFNPYGNSGYADYREFGNPMYSNNPALPGQAILNSRPLISRPRANSFQDYTEELDGVEAGPASGRRSASGNLPYYQAYQRLNSDYNRVYKPNNTEADRRFYERQKEREQKYAQAMKEVDPAKRAKLLREVEKDTLDRPAASRTAVTKGATAPKPNGSTGAVRTPAPVERRQPAPPPFSSNRPSSNRPATRAPAPSSDRSASPTSPSSTTPGTVRSSTGAGPLVDPGPPSTVTESERPAWGRLQGSGRFDGPIDSPTIRSGGRKGGKVRFGAPLRTGDSRV